MATTPIRSLMQMLDAAGQRQGAIDTPVRRSEFDGFMQAQASRVWSRQQEALACAIIAEPPQCLDDVVAVLTQLAGHHDLIMGQGEHATALELRDLHEMTPIAIKNCVLWLASNTRPDVEPTESQHQSIESMAKEAAHWLPTVEGR